VDNHGKVIAERSAKAVTSLLEDEHGISGFRAGEENDLVVGIGLHELEASDVDSLVSERGSQSALNVVQVNEKSVHLNVAGAATLDHDGTIGLHATNIIRVEEHISARPLAEHVLCRRRVVEVLGGTLASDEANNASGALLVLRDDAEGLVKQNEIGAALSGTEADRGWHAIGGAHEHL
ncbi:hypothetical protein BV22DRAFT_1013993, partial [Leucogyrophana mollusca]